MELRDDEYCFACGPKNPIGLHLEFRFEGDEYVADFTPEKHHQSYVGMVHGGIQVTLLDEAMAKLVWAKGIDAVTARIECRFKKPVRPGQPVRVTGRIDDNRGRLILTSAELRGPDGDVLAYAKAKMFKVA